MKQVIFEKSVSGRVGVLPQKCDVPKVTMLDDEFLRKDDALLPELTELDVVRHFTHLSRQNFGVETHFYPLGSCTMKYNPKFCESIAALRGFSQLHPLIPMLEQGEKYSQGALQVLYEMDILLSEITGMNAFSFQPMAGAHGELTGVMIIRAYHQKKGNKKKYVLVPDSSHGTNPASAAIAGYEVKTITSNSQGFMDIDTFKQALTDEVAAVMMTCPNTVGLFNPHIKEISDLAHEKDVLMYYDGANLNAILGVCRPGDLGFDVVHVNLHKTFATPHGSGGPGSGPVGVSAKLSEFLPVPLIKKNDQEKYFLDDSSDLSIGHLAPFYGNFLVILKAYAYITMLGKEGLIKVSENAVLNANYVMEKLKPYYHLPYDIRCMHECVFSAKNQMEHGIHAIDIAKALIDEGIHPPTIYFPLIVKEALMIEPTETESKEILDIFIQTMIKIAKVAEHNPQKLHDAPISTSVSRLDEVKAIKDMNFQYE